VVEIHMELTSPCARATDVHFGAWMGFAPGCWRAAPSDDLPAQVSYWHWAGPFTLGAIWPPRFLPPLPFHHCRCHMCAQQAELSSLPPTLCSLHLGLEQFLPSAWVHPDYHKCRSWSL
jgi:hypothetical protein